MELELTDDQQFFIETTRRYLASEAPTSTIRSWVGEPAGYPDSYWAGGADLGWTSLLADERFSGGTVSGEGLRDLTLVAHAFGYGVAPGPMMGTNVCVYAVGEAGTEAQQERFVPPLVAGEQVAGWALEEPGAGVDLAGLTTRATPTVDGGWRLSGVKGPVEGTTETDWFVVTASCDDGFIQCVIGSGASGLVVETMQSLDYSRRYVQLTLDDVEIGSEDVLGGVDSWRSVAKQLRVATVLQLAETCGCIDRVLGFTIEWAFDRHSFGRPLASYQVLKHRFADMRLWLEACHASADAAARAVQTDDAEADLLVGVASAYVGERAVDIVQDCVQMHGGIGVTVEHDIHLFLRRVAQNCQLLGAPSAHRMGVAAHVESLLDAGEAR